jgi:hypothetical protein
VQFRVSSLKDLTDVIIPFFDKYPLVTQKRADYLLFKQIIELMNKGEHLTQEGLTKILSIKASINLGLSEVLKAAFPNIIPNVRPAIEFLGIPDPH